MGLKITGRELEEDLILLDIKDFDVILDMDWFTAHHTHVDCFHKRVVFKIPNKGSFTI